MRTGLSPESLGYKSSCCLAWSHLCIIFADYSSHYSKQMCLPVMNGPIMEYLSPILIPAASVCPYIKKDCLKEQLDLSCFYVHCCTQYILLPLGQFINLGVTKK
ncbi:hypothetical protein AMECASPLE_005648 [Ameca splendens]|uniref:Uncharacterized protein n=1 Tax=Ameca splendens TaxID=208324 RepID=A0ABV0YXY2_9TELE